MVNYFTLGIIFMTLAILITFISSFYESESVFSKVSSKIGNIIQILFLMGLLLSYQTYINNSKQMELTQLSTLTEKGWVSVYQKIEESYEKCPNFCNSLSFEWQKPLNVDMSTADKKDDYGAVLSLSIFIFQSFNSVIGYYLYYGEGGETMNEWISSFIIWANSNTLMDVWNKNKFIYDKYTQIFVDKIFKMVRENPPKNDKDVVKLSREICHSNEVRYIFNMVKKPLPCE